MNPESSPPKTRSQLAACIDHSVLAAECTAADVRQACQEARSERFAALCVNGNHAELAHGELGNSGVALAVTIGFPLGACSTQSKLFEAREALDFGAKELDVVLALGALRAGDDALVRGELEALVGLCNTKQARLKVILETCLLQTAELLHAIDLSCQAGAHFVKTSTGFSSAGATVEHVALLRERAPAHVGVKAAGGIRSLADAQAMLRAGADRLGCSASMAILDSIGSA